jgi:putative hydrolase of the HAD superfamily
MKSYKHIFFDLDRTLWDFDRNSSDALRDVIKEFGLETKITNIEEFIRLYNKYNDELWEDYRGGIVKKPELRLKRFNLLFSNYALSDQSMIEKISKFYLNTAPLKTSLVTNAKEILEYLALSYKLYIISNGFYDVQLTKTKNSGISPFITKVFTSDRIGSSKPKAGIFEYALTSLHAKKDDCLMVGDDILNDIQGAQNVGIDQVFFNPEKVETSIQPTYEIYDLLMLKEIL